MKDELTEEIKKLNKLLILLLTKELSQNEKIIFLDKSGFQPKDIAEIINTTPNTVRVTLAKIRKNSNKRNKLNAQEST